ncbi:TIGR02530 family flagellar biosynthesis protein [Halalkalibacter urbisdiaboli]|uniref:TIGR02530 family flagellar biosynthesis protein n=1 Tax=Halalkalibacter urbisdiaboli TaxID=1960589 RepID=UPI000B432C82|nr:TIGR02530 family flagellar biosynthesis protein [Halalkalibacter urbisdiaboli]
MDPRMNITHSLQSLPRPFKKANHQTALKAGEFQRLFTNEIQQLKVSKHAQQRMIARGIEISETKWSQIHEKVAEAKQKGVNDSLVLTKNAALVVSAKNDTVITVLDRQEAQSQIFTNINGTILID